jgi:lipocalin
MSNTSNFDVNKYMGTWYELVHYPSWFQRNDNYNTTAEYTMNCDGSVNVHNSTMSNGCKFESCGVACPMGCLAFRVNFPLPEVEKLVATHQFVKPSETQKFKMMCEKDCPNYVIDRIWTNKYGEYVYAVVTDPYKQSLYLLSRVKNPPLQVYNELMQYITCNFNRDRLVQTPHYC